MRNLGLKELYKSKKGNTFIATGIVINHKIIGCPECDTVYLQFHRDGEGTQTLCVTPEEAILISKMLDKTVFNGGH